MDYIILRNTPATNPSRRHLFAVTAVGLALALAVPAHAEAAADAAAKPDAPTEVQEVIVNGVPQHETVLPTRLQATSALGLDIGVMETPRSTTLVSSAQLQTLNITDPRAFSYLTSSSFTSSSYGTVAVPLIRTQLADVYYNGMRNSLNSGYGEPVNLDSASDIAITKGPASVIDGPGPGVGGKVDLLTKRPNMFAPTGQASVTLDTLGGRRWVVDAGGPLIKGDLGVIFSYSGADSASYFENHFFRKNALYGALRWQPTDRYTLDVIGEVNFEQYTTNVGLNRVNQALIDSGQYLTGTVFAPGTTEVQPFGTVFSTTGVAKVSKHITLDSTPGDTSRGELFNFQVINSYRLNDNLTLENNTLFLYLNSTTVDKYYYSDASNGSYTIENKTSLKGDFDFSLGGLSMRNQFVAGATFRVAHTNTTIDFSAEAIMPYDLTGNPVSWQINPALIAASDGVFYKTATGKYIYATPGRDSGNGGGTGVSTLYDTAVFLQDRVEFSPQLSVLFGARIDALQDHTRDPFDCLPDAFTCTADVIPKERTTGVLGIGNANVSAVYAFTPGISSYATVSWTQSPPSPNAAIGGFNAYGYIPDSKLLRGNSILYEGGFKFDLLDKKLFASIAAFDQTHAVPTGPGGVNSADAETRGAEFELNYQPSRNLYVTASYSFTKTKLDQADIFQNFPAQPGINIDSEGYLVTFAPGKYKLPGVPEHLFNVLANYKFDNGIGVRGGVQVTGPMATTTSGVIDVGALTSVLQSYGLPVVIPNSVTIDPRNPNLGYYKSPVIPWQYTMNAAVFYEYGRYTLTLSVYNLTGQKNWQPGPPGNGNDELVRSDPRNFEIRLQAKF